MRKFLFYALIVLATLAPAKDLVHSYYVSIGAGAAITQGDLEGKKKTVIKNNESEEIVYAPYLGIYITPEFEFGANLNQHTIALDFAYSKPATNYAKETVFAQERDSDVLRLGLGYRYNFFWPEPFQVFLGLGYSFMYLNTEENAVILKDQTVYRNDATYLGNSFGVSLGTFYYISRHLTMEMHTRIRKTFFFSVGTDSSDFYTLDNPLKQYSEEVVLKFAYHF